MVLLAIAATACLLGLWGAVANLAIPLMPDYGKRQWNFFGPFEQWNDAGTRAEPGRELRAPWWAISFQTPWSYLDPWLAGPVGLGFYALCFTWGMGTFLVLRSSLRTATGRVVWPVILFGIWWLIALGGIIAHVLFFASIAREAVPAVLSS